MLYINVIYIYFYFLYWNKYKSYFAYIQRKMCHACNLSSSTLFLWHIWAKINKWLLKYDFYAYVGVIMHIGFFFCSSYLHCNFKVGAILSCKICPANMVNICVIDLLLLISINDTNLCYINGINFLNFYSLRPKKIVLFFFFVYPKL